VIVMVRRWLAALGAALLLTAGAAVGATAHPDGDSQFPDRIDLPRGFQPEGIAIRGHTAWLGSLADGDIYEVDLRTGEGEVLAQGPGTTSVGLKVDRHERLFVAGGFAGDARVVDTETGETLASYRLASAPTIINDVVLTRHSAWFTDSSKAVLHRLPLGRHGSLPDADEVEHLTLTGEWQQIPGEFPAGVNANGIERTPDRHGLLVVNSASGALFRVDPRTGDARRVELTDPDDLNGDPADDAEVTLAGGDGLLLRGRNLYVVLNRGAVYEFDLDRSARAGTLDEVITSEDFAVPTTAARLGRWLYIPNARFDVTPTPTTEYWITRVDR
jgi:sugar lactone lactonase YvrE